MFNLPGMHQSTSTRDATLEPVRLLHQSHKIYGSLAESSVPNVDSSQLKLPRAGSMKYLKERGLNFRKYSFPNRFISGATKGFRNPLSVFLHIQIEE